MIGKRLKLARGGAGVSLRELAAKIQNRVTAQQIGKYERDLDLPNSGVLIALSDALNVPIDYLVASREMTLAGVEFRKRRIAAKKEEERIQAKALHWIERYLAIEEILGLPSGEWDKPRECPYPVREVAQADIAAQSLREHWNLGIDPIPNLIELLEEHGVKILIVESRDPIDGMAGRVLRREGEPVWIIVLRKGASGERQRFSLAHELGHMVLQPEGDPRFSERAAHRFAGALLMPAEALWANVGKHRHSIGWSELRALKKLFGASMQAIVYRCGDLGIFSPAMTRRLFREFSRLGYRSPPNYEPDALPEEKPERFARLCDRALAECAISESKAAELLDIPIRELQKRMEPPPPYHDLNRTEKGQL